LLRKEQKTLGATFFCRTLYSCSAYNPHTAWATFRCTLCGP